MFHRFICFLGVSVYNFCGLINKYVCVCCVSRLYCLLGASSSIPRHFKRRSTWLIKVEAIRFCVSLFAVFVGCRGVGDN